MNIQQSINALVRDSAIAARISPFGAIAEERAVAKANERTAVKLEKQYEDIQAEIEKYPAASKMTEEERLTEYELVQKAAGVVSKAYDVSPTAERLEAATTWREVAAGWKKPEEIRQQMQEKAVLHGKMEQARKRAQQASREFTSIITGGGDIEEWKRKYGGEV